MIGGAGEMYTCPASGKEIVNSLVKLRDSRESQIYLEVLTAMAKVSLLQFSLRFTTCAHLWGVNVVWRRLYGFRRLRCVSQILFMAMPCWETQNVSYFSSYSLIDVFVFLWVVSCGVVKVLGARRESSVTATWSHCTRCLEIPLPIRSTSL
jgi:hypothetical protein